MPDVERCPKCRRLVNRFVNARCPNPDCRHRFVDLTYQTARQLITGP